MIEPGSDPVSPDLPLSQASGLSRPRSLSLSWMVKRGLDFVLSATTIFLLLPLMLLVAGAILAIDRSQPIERDTRLGCDGRRFDCLRFRTTGPGHPAMPDTPLAREPTPLGRVLSETSLDELPKLLNVLRGEMSFVGPRPLSRRDAARHGPDLDARLAMPPGLTGAWQVDGGPDATEAERTALDLDYAKRWSLRRDLGILLRGIAQGVGKRDRA